MLVVDYQSCEVIAFLIFHMGNLNGLVAAKLIKCQPAVLTFAVITGKNQAADFVASFAEENHSRRSFSFAFFVIFAVHRAGMLTRCIGNDHFQLTVFFDNIDALDIDFAELLNFIGRSGS